jgi:hypothetical protein
VFISAVDLLDTYNTSMWCPTRSAAALTALTTSSRHFPSFPTFP